MTSSRTSRPSVVAKQVAAGRDADDRGRLRGAAQGLAETEVTQQQPQHGRAEGAAGESDAGAAEGLQRRAEPPSG